MDDATLDEIRDLLSKVAASLPARASDLDAEDKLQVVMKHSNRLVELMASTGGRGNVGTPEPAVRDASAVHSAVSKTEHLVRILDATPVAVIVAKATSGQIVFTNSVACQMFGYSAEQLLALRIEDIAAMEPCRLKAETELEQGDEVETTREAQCLRKDRSKITTNLSIFRMALDDLCLVACFVDISEQKATEQELRRTHEHLQGATASLVQTEKLTALGELAAGISHELNQPLNALKIIAQSSLRAVDKGTAIEGEMVEDVREILELVNTMAATIDHMRLFVRSSGHNRLQPLDVNTLVDRTLGLTSRQLEHHHIETAKELAADLPQVMADAVQLGQVLVNLLMNARGALDECDKAVKKIKLRTFLRQTGDTRIICVEVQDNAGGIPRHLRDQVFLPFFTTKKAGKGTGLGLSIAHKIIQYHGGRLGVESEVGKGSVFRMELPELGAPPLVTIPPPEISDSDEKRPTDSRDRILIVEDSAVTRNLLAWTLKEEGYEVSEADSAAYALELLKTVTPQLIITDIGLPGIDGVELIRLVRADHKDLPILVISGQEIGAHGESAIDAGANFFLAKKDFDSEVLHDVVSKLLSKP